MNNEGVLMRPDLPAIKQWKPNNSVRTKPNQGINFVVYVHQTNKTVCETKIGDQDFCNAAENHAPFFTLFVLLNLSFTGASSVVELKNFYYVFPQIKVICNTLDGT